eukprot:CAMPEP_0172754806 /NCGR_PEP_ID=MMETSP1074-20121228/158686_1 /TAXON_ID=2916 /ORGANISM="Ceratium fusus, Strain PA161109" /LENGTH=89 /DNA_ID=CAMNT_0013587801 /DNA_START=80 /DNA_END=348 /DNA_ORIENTATION=-
MGLASAAVVRTSGSSEVSFLSSERAPSPGRAQSVFATAGAGAAAATADAAGIVPAAASAADAGAVEAASAFVAALSAAFPATADGDAAQ